MNEPIFAVVTPFQADASFSVDLGALRDLLALLAGCGVRRIVANGTTGEFPALSSAERRAVLEECRRSFPGEVIAHVSSTCAADVREALAHARDHADAALLLPPYYFADIPQEGALAFLVPLAEESPLPLYLYNFPRHTQVTLGGDLVEEIARRAPALRGLKDSSGNLASAVALKERLGPELEVYLGADSLVYQALAGGLDGSVTGGAQPVPELLLEVATRYAAGETEKARQAQERLDQWTTSRKQGALAEPAVLKAALGERLPGFPPAVRPPFLPAGESAVALLRQAVRQALAAPTATYSRVGRDYSPTIPRP